MRIFAILALLLGSASAMSVHAQASDAETKQINLQCSAQIAALVQTAHQAPGGTMKKVVFKDSVDAEYLGYFKELQTLMKSVQGSTSPNKEVAQKISAVHEKISALSQKVASNEVAACTDWMKAQFSGLKTVCPNYESDLKVPEKAKACNEKTAATPEVKAKFDKWLEAQKALVLPKK